MTAHEPRAAVVVLIRDRRDQLPRTLNRLARLAERPPVVVVGNASSDGTAGAAAGRR